MYTRCPYCHTYFKVLAEHIKKAGGKVRCGQCYKVFNSIGNLIEKLPVPLTEKRNQQANSDLGQKPPPSPETPAPTPAGGHGHSHDSHHTEIKSSPVDGPHMRQKQSNKAKYQTRDSIESIILSRKDKIGVQDGTKPPARDLIVHPDYGMHEHEDIPGDNNLAWGLGLAVLLCFFVIQYSYFYRADLAQHAELKPWLQMLCEIANCKIPDKLDIRAIKLTRRDITTHPKIDKALLISASIVNDAEMTQPFPVMRIRLSDTVGQILASRKFNPQDYLDADVNLKKGMPPGSPIQINLEILDPGKNAINFEFDFFYPRS